MSPDKWDPYNLSILDDLIDLCIDRVRRFPAPWYTRWMWAVILFVLTGGKNE